MPTAAKVYSESGSHYYFPDGRPCFEVDKADGKGTTKTTLRHARKLGLLPSTTTILRMLDKPALTAWKIETACLAVLTSPRLASEELDAFVRRVLQTDKEQDAESAKARELGTRVHDAIELFLNGEPSIQEELMTFVRPVIKSICELGNVQATEKIIVGDSYAGKLDAIVENDTHITVIDFKTCKTIPKASYDEHRLQLASYAAALGNTGRKLIRTANIYISTTNPGEVKTIIHEDWQETFTNGFEPLIKLWQWSNSHAPISSKMDIFAGA